jgi:hypothetical protein
MSDVHPDHYAITLGDGYECEVVDVLRGVLSPAEFIGWCRGSQLAYLMRAGKKRGEPPTTALLKARRFNEYEVDFLAFLATREFTADEPDAEPADEPEPPYLWRDHITG